MRTSLYVGIDYRGKLMLLDATLYHLRPYLSAALQHSHDDRFTVSALSTFAVKLFLILRLVHILDLAANERFVHFNRATFAAKSCHDSVFPA